MGFESLNAFYLDTVNRFTNGTLDVMQGDYGYEVRCKQEYQPEDTVMIIQWNDTISSFDTHYHSYNSLIGTILANQSLSLSELDKELIKLIINVNYMAYIDLETKGSSSSDFKEYLLHMLNLDDYYFDYLPYWNSELKLLLKKLSGSPIIDKDLLYYNDSMIISTLLTIKDKVKEAKDNRDFLSMNSIKASINLILSKAFVFSLKAYKIITHSPNITQSDLNIKGYILIPGADIINHKKITVSSSSSSSSSSNVDKTQIKYEKGSILIKSGSKFKIGDPFTINYDTFESLENIMKRFGFSPIESLNDNMVYSLNYYNVSTDIITRICYALSACAITSEHNIIQIVQYTNMPSYGKLTLHRLNNWREEPLTKRKMVDVYEKLRQMTHLNTTEGMALSDYGSEYYGTLMYQANFQLPIEALLTMYNQNENEADVGSIIDQYDMKGYKFNSSYEEYVKMRKGNGNRKAKNKGMVNDELIGHRKNMQRKFREMIKYCLIEHHVIALNMRESIDGLNKTLDNLSHELEKEIIAFFN